ncbi:CYTH domain-containing protein [Endozoicomonas gorgoniicola]|uniref:CYTH domain-containing protein n=1 Tax=Endozoicomonas gorgoniicola TaxID=1234144 RepID=A0ABT3N3R1_9GAMM|nr:CYTH domain-containing protein [Endozoicomonas gorgoniicola]MCW7555839.1 CYTH domain-containing protein [Endozoicomonas gorgoniicola]
MSFETELKLSLSENSISQLKTHSFWKKFAVEGPKTFHLGNIYYDTADMALNQARVALRIREKNGEYFQTLKTKGESANGLTRRGEWEWRIPDNQLDFSGLTEVWPESLQGVAPDQLQPLFATDFDRTTWLVEYSGARVEAALDKGLVKSGEAHSPICELELELIEGDESVLQQIADELGQTIQLTPSDQSKAERGFELLYRSG